MASPATPHDDHDDAALNQEVELYGPEDGGWYSTRIYDWIGLCEDLRDPDCRGYMILRALVIEKWENPVRKLTLRELCELIPSNTKGMEGKSSLSRVRGILASLSKVGLVTTPEGGPVKTSSRPSSLDKPLRLRINDMPKPGYKGWRNAESKLAAISGRRPVDHPGQETPKAGRKSNPAGGPKRGAGLKSNPVGSKSNPLGSKSNPHPASDQAKRDLPLVPSLGSSLSGAAETQQEQESRGPVQGEREAAEPKNNPVDSPADAGGSSDVDKVVDAYIAAYMTAVGLPPHGNDVKAIRTAAVALLSVGRSVGNLCTLAAELPSKGWTDLVKHAQMNPEAAPRPAAQSKPWCGECNFGTEPTAPAQRMREGADGRMEKCHCHPGYVPPQPSHA